MARNVPSHGRPQGRSTGPTSGLNLALPVEQFMLVVAENDSLTHMVSLMYDQMHSKIAGHGGTMEFTEEEFFSYVLTAFKVRVEHVLHGRWRSLGHEPTGMNVRDRWVIPVPVHDVLSSIGTVRIGASGLQILPLWETTADAQVLTREQRDLITPKLQSAVQLCDFRYLPDISADDEGHQQVMLITYLPTRGEWWTTEPVGREDGAASLVAGLVPVTDVRRGRGHAEYTIVDTEQLAAAITLIPAWIPPLSLNRVTVVRYMPELADMSR